MPGGESLLEETIEAHGGETAWASISEITADVRSGGLLPRTRLPGNRLAEYSLTVSTRRPYAVFDPFPRPGRRGVFDGGLVKIETDSCETVERRSDARRLFFGRPGLRRNLSWDALDSVYFAGYAMSNYLTQPFMLRGSGVEVRRGPDYRRKGETWRLLVAHFPDSVHTHCPEQRFHIDPEGLIRRHDYSPDVVSPRAVAAHISDDFVRVGGIAFATRRRVYPIGFGRVLPGPVMVSIDLSSIETD